MSLLIPFLKIFSWIFLSDDIRYSFSKNLYLILSDFFYALQINSILNIIFQKFMKIDEPFLPGWYDSCYMRLYYSSVIRSSWGRRFLYSSLVNRPGVVNPQDLGYPSKVIEHQGFFSIRRISAEENMADGLETGGLLGE